jgi:sulfide dehydrogenase cytochrome subunit
MNLQRRPRRPFTFAPLGSLIIVLSLAACGGGDPAGAQAQATASDTELASGRSTSTALIAQPTNTEGRLLASNCFQCHGTLGTGGFEEIRGKSANELLEFQSKPAARDIMAAHAQGYTPEQLGKIAAYLKQ